MRNWSSGLLAYYAQAAKTRVVCCEIVREDGHADRGTTYGEDLTIDGDLYEHATGGEVSDVESNATLDVANAEMKIPFTTLSTVTRANIRKGLYRGATVHLFLVNPDNLTHGKGTLLKKKIGQVTVERGFAVFELRGVFDAYQQSVGFTCIPNCQYQFGNGATYTIYGRDFVLGDNRCKFDLTPVFVDGVLDSVSADGRTFFASDRTEPGPSGGIDIDDISNANPGIVTLDGTVPANNTAGVISGLTSGMATLNGTVIVRDRTDTTFALPVDTTSYGAYPGGGVFTPLGSDAGLFAYGLMFASKDGVTLAREIKSYINTGSGGQWTTHEAFPFALAAADAYTLMQGCNRTEARCKELGNYIHFGGFPRVPLMDSIKQVGRSE